jgi:uncharacterized repeat protein (TIGR02543 family)
VVSAVACKALAEDGSDPDYFMPPPGGVIVRYETGKGSYVPYEAGLAPGNRITRPVAPIWPDPAAAGFGGWYKDNLTFFEPWNFGTDTISPDAGKYLTLYAKWQATQTERWIARNWIWNNQGAHAMGQVVKLQPGEEYTLYIKYWMQGGNSTQENFLVAFCVDPVEKTRLYSVRESITWSDLWAQKSFTFTAQNEWYAVGVFPGLTTVGGGTFYLREMKLTKTGDNTNLLSRSKFEFGVGLDEEKTYYTQGYITSALTTTTTTTETETTTEFGIGASFTPGIWYFATPQIFNLMRESSFWADSSVISQISSQGGAVYLED